MMRRTGSITLGHARHEPRCHHLPRFAVIHSTDVRRVFFALLVTLLCVSASGVHALFVPEPCAVAESGGSNADECVPTCPTCGCCSQPLVVALTQLPDVGLLTTSYETIDVTAPSARRPRDVFHVPKTIAL